jgi:micrococcal nuclease
MPIAAQAQSLQGTVTRISDGDTVWIRTSSSSRPIKVRIQGVDAPEICQAGGQQARDALRTRLLSQTVLLKARSKDDFGRTLGTIEHAGQDVGQWLVRQGHAWSYSFRHRPSVYAKEQAAAQAQRLGVWQQAKPQEPRAFRKQHGPCLH